MKVTKTKGDIMFSKLNKFIFTLTCGLFLTSGASAACTYYIAPNGSDSGAGSISSPWATINYASGKLTPGQTLCARGGTYYKQAGYIWHSSGTATAPVTFRNYPGEKPVFDGEWGDTGTEGDFLVFTNNSWVVVDGITAQRFTDQYGNGTIDFTNNLGAVDNIIIQNSTFQDNGSNVSQDHHIYIATGATNITIRNNLFIRGAGSAVQAYHTPAASKIKIYNNVMVGGLLNCTQSKTYPCAAGSVSNWGIIIGDATDVQIYNNTIYGMQRGIDFNYGSGGSAATGPYVVRNNLIINSTEFGLRVGSMYTPYASSDYNDFYGNNTDIVWGSSYFSLAQFAASTANDHHSISANPSFVSVGSNFHLNSNSPVIDKGVVLSLVSTDMDGLSRSSGASFDIGAYEYAGSTTTTKPIVSLSANALTFGNQMLGSSSAVQYVTITNIGNADLIFGNDSVSGDFAFANLGTCTSTLVAGASCTYSLKFTPTVVWARSGALTIYTNADSTPIVVVLSGVGLSLADVTAPLTAITAPTYNSYVAVRTSVTIQAQASDNVAVKSVEFYVNGALKCTNAVAPYQCRWYVPRTRGVSYSLQTKAYDAAGNVKVSSVVRVTSK
jgi:hypothetical protein